jgi:hypothetical protein
MRNTRGQDKGLLSLTGLGSSGQDVVEVRDKEQHDIGGGIDEDENQLHPVVDAVVLATSSERTRTKKKKPPKRQAKPSRAPHLDLLLEGALLVLVQVRGFLHVPSLTVVSAIRFGHSRPCPRHSPPAEHPLVAHRSPSHKRQKQSKSADSKKIGRF